MTVDKQIQTWRSRADHFRERAREFEDKAFELQQDKLKEVRRKQQDRLINRTQAIELLWFNSHSALKNWEQKVSPIGYLKFEGNAILRSEVLRFRDDYSTGLVNRKLRKHSYNHV